MFPTAVSFALVAMFAWAIWALLATRATQWLAPEVAVVLSYLATIPVAIGYVLYTQNSISMPAVGVGYAIGAGVFVALGTIAFYAGLQTGDTGIVTAVSGLYFVVAAVLGILLFGETLAWRDLLGIGFAVAAILLIAT